MNIRELKKIPDDTEVIVFREGICISPDIDDELLYDKPILEIGCGW